MSWTTPIALPVELYLPAPYTVSQAYDVNNGGWIAGEMYDPAGEQRWKAVLWGPGGAFCSLHPPGQTESVALGVDEVHSYTVLVAGTALPLMKPIIWRVDVTTCAFTYETIDVYAGDATDVRYVAGSWEAVGADDEFFRGQPAWWSSDGSSELLYGKQGDTYAINGAGHIVGWRDHAGPKPVLWVPGGN